MGEGHQQDDLAWYACTEAEQLSETGAWSKSALLRNCATRPRCDVNGAGYAQLAINLIGVGECLLSNMCLSHGAFRSKNVHAFALGKCIIFPIIFNKENIY